MEQQHLHDFGGILANDCLQYLEARFNPNDSVG
jgi:hypothetical protein